MVSKGAALKCCANFWRILFIILNSVFGVSEIASSLHVYSELNHAKVNQDHMAS